MVISFGREKVGTVAGCQRPDVLNYFTISKTGSLLFLFQTGAYDDAFAQEAVSYRRRYPKSKDRKCRGRTGEDSTLLYWLLIALGVGAIVIIVRQILARSHQLNERIEQYHQEGPPADPYGELARLIAEDRLSRPGGRSTRGTKEPK